MTADTDPLIRPPRTCTVYLYAREFTPRVWQLFLDANSSSPSTFRPRMLDRQFETVDTADAALDELELAALAAGWVLSGPWEPARNGAGYVAWVEPWQA